MMLEIGRDWEIRSDSYLLFLVVDKNKHTMVLNSCNILVVNETMKVMGSQFFYLGFRVIKKSAYDVMQN